MSENNKKQTRRRLNQLHLFILAPLSYAALCVLYIHLPAKIRQPIWQNASTLNQRLTNHGNAICDFTDNLGLWGHDQSVTFKTKYNGQQIYGGEPKQKLTTLHRITLLENSAFTVGYSEYLKNPLWVAYRLFDVPTLDSGNRPSHFTIDTRTQARVSPDDYTHSGFDRGHMAPNYAIATRHGDAAQKETFRMSNIIPQTPDINQHIWKDLEMTVAKKYGRYFGEVWIITGPIFRTFPDRLKSGVAIPDAYYKIILDESGTELRALAFIIDKESPPYTRLKTHLVSIDEIEEKTGLNFLSDLQKKEEIELEAKPAKRLWPTFSPAIKYHLGMTERNNNA
jgi:endonuclease G